MPGSGHCVVKQGALESSGPLWIMHPSNPASCVAMLNLHHTQLQPLTLLLEEGLLRPLPRAQD